MKSCYLLLLSMPLGVVLLSFSPYPSVILSAAKNHRYDYSADLANLRTFVIPSRRRPERSRRSVQRLLFGAAQSLP